MFELKFSPVIIKHLGLSMYTTLPPVLSELITNSYDADSSIVTITINKQKNSIEILDNGCGMDEYELNNDFLNVGRNRREKDTKNETRKYARKVTGKKGIGKLSVFGICKEIYVESCKNNKINSFKMNYDELLNRDNDEPINLKPEIDNEDTEKDSYTKISLQFLTRKSPIDIYSTSNSILTRLNIFDSDFKCKIIDEAKIKELTQESRAELIEKNMQFYWDLLNDMDKLGVDEDTKKYLREKNITGRIITTKETIKESLKGITLYARGKLANNPEFYGVKLSNSHAFSYMSGSIQIDFMDDDLHEDNISTARNSLIWENDSAQLLQKHLQHIIKKIGLDWRTKRIEIREKDLKKEGINAYWYDGTSQSNFDKTLAKKITDIVISSELEISKTKNLLEYVKGAFEFEVFQEYARSIENNVNGEEMLRLLQDWEIIEAREYYRLALGRIETIEKFKELISKDTLEVAKAGIESMHSFLEKFPWILEPRISSFDDEVTYKELLKKEFNDDREIDENKRIDFVCKGDRDTLYIIEIKRSQKTINKKDLEQLNSYCEFIQVSIKNNHSDRGKYKYLKGYIVGKKLSEKYEVEIKLGNMNRNNMYFLSYETMLGQAEQYHKDFIVKYEKINKILPKNKSKQ